MNQTSLAFTHDFSAFYKLHLAAVRRVVRSFRVDEATAEDLIQDTFLIAWRKVSQVRNPGAVRAWLLTLTKNLCLNHLRKQKLAVSLSDRESEAESSPCLLSYSLATTQVEESFQIELSLKLIRELIEEHGHPERREVARRFYQEEQSVATIAEECGLKPNTVLSHLRRFRLIAGQALVEMLDERNPW